MNETYVLFVIAWVAIMGGIGMAIGNYRNRLLAGFVWGAVLGIFGWLLVWLGPTSRTPRRRPGNW